MAHPIGMIIALSMQASAGNIDQAKGDISVSTGQDERAASISTFTAKCGDLELQISAGYGESPRGGPARRLTPSIAMNGRVLPIEGTALAQTLGRDRRLSKYDAYCGRPKNAIFVRYYAISREKRDPAYLIGSFTVARGGGTIFHGETRVALEDFWFG